MRYVNQYFLSRPETIVPPLPNVALVGPNLGTGIKCNSGTYCPLTDKIYFSPWNGQSILEFDYQTFTATWITPNIAGSDKFSGMVHTGELIIMIPLSYPYPVWFNPVTKEYGNIGTAISGVLKWYGGCLANDGFVYCTPYRGADRVLKIDPVNLTHQLVGPIIGGTNRFSGSCLYAENKIMMANRELADPASFNAADQTLSFIPDVGANSVNKQWSTQALGDGRAFMIKCSWFADQIYNPASNEFTLVGPGTVASANRNYGVGLAPNGLLYSTPATYNSIEVFNLNTNTISEIPTGVTGSEKWLGGPVLAPDGAFYYPPFATPRILRVTNIGTPRPSMFEFPSNLTDFHLTDWNIYQNRY